MPTSLLMPMLVGVSSADARFIDLDNAARFRLRFNKGSADYVAHGPSGFVATKTHKAVNLQSAHSFFAGKHQMSDLEPVSERLSCSQRGDPGNR